MAAVSPEPPHVPGAGGGSAPPLPSARRCSRTAAHRRYAGPRLPKEGDTGLGGGTPGTSRVPPCSATTPGVPDARVEEVVAGGAAQQVPQGEAMGQELWELVAKWHRPGGPAPHRPRGTAPRGPTASPWPWWRGPCRAAAATRGGGGRPGHRGRAPGMGTSDPAPRWPRRAHHGAGGGWGPWRPQPRSEVPAAPAAAIPAPSRPAPGATWGESGDTDQLLGTRGGTGGAQRCAKPYLSVSVRRRQSCATSAEPPSPGLGPVLSPELVLLVLSHGVWLLGTESLGGVGSSLSPVSLSPASCSPLAVIPRSGGQRVGTERGVMTPPQGAATHRAIVVTP